METLMPMIFTPPDMRSMGQQMSTAMLPMLNEMNEIMRRRGDQLSRLGFQTMTTVLNAMQNIRGLRPDVFTVQVLNLDFLELMAAGSFAFLVLIFLKLHECCRQSITIIFQIQQVIVQILTQIREMNITLGDINVNIRTMISITANISLTLQLMLRAIINFNFDVNARLDAILNVLNNIDVSLRAILLKLDGILQLLTEISGKLSLINQAILNLTARLDAIGARIIALLEAILAQLQAGIRISGTINLVVNVTKTIGFDIDWLDLLKMLFAGIAAVFLLSAALATLVGFVYLLGEVLAGFGLQAVIGMIFALAALIAFVYLLSEVIKGFDLKQILLLGLALAVLALFVRELGKALKDFELGTVIGLVLALAGLAAFVYFLGKGLQGFNKDVLAAIPQLDKLFDSLIKLAQAIAAFSTDQMIRIGLGLLGIVIFLGLLGLVLRLFNADVLNALPGLGQLFDSLIGLANAIAGFSMAQMQQIGIGLLGIVVFLGLLGLVLRLFNADVLNALPGLAQLFDSLINLATVIAGFSPDQMIQIGIGLLGIVVFLGLLSFALNNFNADVLNALPGLAILFDSLIRLANAIVSFSPDQLIMIGIAMAVLTAFMFGMAFALDLATPGLLALAAALGRLESLFNSVANAARSAWSVISSAPNLGGLGISLPSFQGGGVMAETGMAFLHAGERVLTPGEAALYESGQAGAGSMSLAQPVDQSVNIQGGITVNVSAERMDSAAVPQVTDEIVRQLQARLSALRTEQNFRMGARSAAPA